MNCPKCGLDLNGARTVTREFISNNLFVDGHYTPEGVWEADTLDGTRPLPSNLIADGSDFCNACGTPVKGIQT